jgi:hypothetical protein
MLKQVVHTVPTGLKRINDNNNNNNNNNNKSTDGQTSHGQ